ncbi:hypothetical protein [Nonomuraea sp. NPDC052265]|uniref:hypothetical protein n=1 Tax=Nonomuraea sp. NPDC052265 TaxID=3364374 RepID=UPI0037CB2F62
MSAAEPYLLGIHLKQIGTNPLLSAADEVDHTRGYTFSTYGMWWIRQAIEGGIHDKSRTVRLPVHVAEHRTMSADVQRVVTSLPPREASVIKLRYGLSGLKAQSEIAGPPRASPPGPDGERGPAGARPSFLLGSWVRR